MITSKERLKLIIVDGITMTIVLMVLFLPFDIYDTITETTKIGDVYAPKDRSIAYSIYNFFVLSIFLNKDALSGMSIGKRISGFKIVDFNSGKIASPLKCLIRNSTILVWPIELVFVFVNRNRRLGDFIAGTKLVKQEGSLTMEEVNYWKILVSLCLPILILIVIKLLVYGDLAR